MVKQSRYASTITGASSIIQETYTVLAELGKGSTIAEVREWVIQGNPLGKKTERSREKIWQNIHNRFISRRDEDFVHLLARVVTSELPELTRRQILFYEFAQSDALIYDLTTDCLYGLYYDGRSLITKADIDTWFESVEEKHPELRDWTEQTRKRVNQHYLTIVKDFGLLEGRGHKYFTKPYIPLPTFLWLLYRLRDKGFPTRAIIESKDFHLFLMDQDEVLLLINEASNAGHIQFRSAGDIYDLKFTQQELTEVMDGFTA